MDERGNIKYLWALVGGYLIWLGIQQFQYLYRGAAPYPAVSALAGALFAVVGALLLFREWRAYQYAKAHKDDPETWSGAPDSEESGDAAEEPDAEPDDAEDEGAAAEPEDSEEQDQDEDEDWEDPLTTAPQDNPEAWSGAQDSEENRTAASRRLPEEEETREYLEDSEDQDEDWEDREEDAP